MSRTIFVFCGGARTFLECFDTCFKNVVSRLCPDLSKITLLFYMKLTDPGPKQQAYWNHSYRDNNYDEILAKINEYRAKGLKIYHKILFHSEVNDIELMATVKNRRAYVGFNEYDIHFIRALQNGYTLERAGLMLLDIEKEQGYEFDTAVYIRPDLFFTSESAPLSEFIMDKPIFCTGINDYSYDHFAIIPRFYMSAFFLGKMITYRTNMTTEYVTPEHLYIQVPHKIETIANYYIKREDAST